MNNFLLKFNRE